MAFIALDQHSSHCIIFPLQLQLRFRNHLFQATSPCFNQHFVTLLSLTVISVLRYLKLHVREHLTAIYSPYYKAGFFQCHNTLFNSYAGGLIFKPHRECSASSLLTEALGILLSNQGLQICLQTRSLRQFGWGIFGFVCLGFFWCVDGHFFCFLIEEYFCALAHTSV